MADPKDPHERAEEARVHLFPGEEVFVEDDEEDAPEIGHTYGTITDEN